MNDTWAKPDHNLLPHLKSFKIPTLSSFNGGDRLGASQPIERLPET